eukprot:GILJ01006925.1.p1 GENE.GILJ01006925.1~~GILJ01006925.1.p1  ORF type:complete len:161 (+),score=15.82 GILJ01006925.1:37-519(+)
MSLLVSCFQFTSAMCTALFAGGASYINFAGLPALLHNPKGAKQLVEDWMAMYEHSAGYQASLALLGGISGLVVSVSAGDRHSLLGSCCLLSVVPFTLFVMKPVINQPLFDLYDDFSKDRVKPAYTLARVRSMMSTWKRFHAVRSVLSLAALGLILYSLKQ